MAILPSAFSYDSGGLAVHDIAGIAEGEGDIGKSIRRKVFISYHVEDRDQVKQFADSIGIVIVDKSVKDSDIDDRNIKTATIRQKIREDFIADASVTIVLIGPCTWQRKHVDWEVGSSLRQTKKNSRCGLLGILLPNHPDYGKPSGLQPPIDTATIGRQLSAEGPVRDHIRLAPQSGKEQGSQLDQSGF